MNIQTLSARTAICAFLGATPVAGADAASCVEIGRMAMRAAELSQIGRGVQEITAVLRAEFSNAPPEVIIRIDAVANYVVATGMGSEAAQRLYESQCLSE